MDQDPKKEKVAADTSPKSELVLPLQTLNTDIEKYLRDNKGEEKSVAAALKRKRKNLAPKESASPTVPVPVHPPKPTPRSMVLPTKEVHSPLNARRADASILVEQEHRATLPKPPQLTPLPVQEKPPNQVDQVETYEGDIQQLVKDKGVSPVTVAAEEARRRAGQPLEPEPPSHVMRNIFAVSGGVVLIVAAMGAFAFAYIHSQALPLVQAPTAPYIAVDATSDIQFQETDTRKTMMTALVAAKSQVHLSAGLVAQLRLWLVSSSSPAELPAQTFFATLTPNIPPELLRTIQPSLFLGVHSLNTNQPFVIVSVDSYEGGYAGMLDWEKTLKSDLSPLFDYVPISANNTQTFSTATTTPQVLASPFVDAIVENHDARVIKNSNGDILLLWTFLDRSTILITTNQNTLHEIISRLKVAPKITPVGQ